MTIVVDTSALAAVIFGESDAERYSSLLHNHAGECLISAATRVEIGIVVEARQGPEATTDLASLLAITGMNIEPLDAEQAAIAMRAWQRFGKGHHPAALNLGDCFSYALAKVTGSPLLYKGDDFTQTDVMRVM